jgi:hypothetical protein
MSTHECAIHHPSGPLNHSVALLTLLLSFSVGASAGKGQQKPFSIPSAISTRILDVNRLNIQITDRGKLITNLLGDGGGMWWFTETSREWVIYDQGPWIIGKINGMPTMGNAYWGTSYLPGGITDGRPALEVHPQDSVRFPSIQDHPHKRSIRS